MRARISLVQGRVLSTASRFSLESCMHENFPNSLHADLTTRALSASANESTVAVAARSRTLSECRLQNPGIASDTPATTVCDLILVQFTRGFASRTRVD